MLPAKFKDYQTSDSGEDFFIPYMGMASILVMYIDCQCHSPFPWRLLSFELVLIYCISILFNKIFHIELDSDYLFQKSLCLEFFSHLTFIKKQIQSI